MSEGAPTSDERTTSKRIDDLFQAEDVETATTEFERLLDATDYEVETTGGHDRKRLHIQDGEDLFLKTLRSEDSDAGLDLFAERVGYRFLNEFNLPVATLSLVENNEYGPCLVMRDLQIGISESSHSDLTTFTNGDQAPTLYAFELWLQNYDDKNDHFRVIELDGNTEFRVIDHGHVGHRDWYARDQIDDPSEIDGTLYLPPTHSKAGTKPSFFGVEGLSDADPGASVINSIPDEQIERIVCKSCREVCDLDSDHADVEEFREESGFHEDVMVKLLKVRRDGIYDIIDDRVA